MEIYCFEIFRLLETQISEPADYISGEAKKYLRTYFRVYLRTTDPKEYIKNYMRIELVSGECELLTLLTLCQSL